MPDPETEQPGIGTLLTQLAEDVKGYARAEADYYRAVATAKLRELRGALLAGLLALALALAAAIGLVVGAVMTLATLVGPGWATLIVVALCLAVAALLGWSAWKGVQRAMGDAA